MDRAQGAAMRRRLFLLALCVLAAPWLTAPGPAEAAARRVAVVVGNNHGGAGKVRLRYAERDARRIGALLVCDDDRVVGIFTERDVLNRVVDPGKDPGTVRVADVMTGDVVTIGPEVSVEEAMAVVTEKRCRHLPVMTGEQLLGLISIGDLTRWVATRQAHHIQDLVNYITGRYPA